MTKKIIGIDLGTTNSVVAIMEGRDPKVIENEEGTRITPSVVGFSKDGEILVGQVARRQSITNPENTVYSIKRFMGRKYAETADERRRVPYKVVPADNGDVAIEVAGKKYSPPEISAKILQKLKRAADTHLGGDDLDQRVMEWLIDEFKKENGIDVSKDKMVLQRLKEASEKAKIELSSVLETEINLPFLTADQTGPKHLVKKLTRARFEQMCEDLFQRAIDPTKKCLADAKKSPKEIDEVVLVGGSTRVPKIQQIVKEFFGKEP